MKNVIVKSDKHIVRGKLESLETSNSVDKYTTVELTIIVLEPLSIPSNTRNTIIIDYTASSYLVMTYATLIGYTMKYTSNGVIIYHLTFHHYEYSHFEVVPKIKAKLLYEE